jgi:hypothetical protein
LTAWSYRSYLAPEFPVSCFWLRVARFEKTRFFRSMLETRNPKLETEQRNTFHELF